MLKIIGLKTIAGESKNLDGRCFLQVNYNISTGRAWTDMHVGESWSQYHDRNVLYCGRLYGKATMKEIREMIEDSYIYHLKDEQELGEA